MAEAFIDTLELFPRGLVYVALGIGILVIAKIAQDLASPYKIGYQLSHKDNVALALSIAGYYFGVIAVFLGALFQPFGSTVIADGNLGFTTDYWQGVLEVFIYALVGIFVLNVSRIIVDKLVLYRFSTEEEIIEQHNVGRVRRVGIEWSDSNGLFISVTEQDEPMGLSIIGLDHDELVRIDEEHSIDNHITYENEQYNYSNSFEVYYFKDGIGEGEGFYMWEFIREDRQKMVSVVKWESTPFEVYTSVVVSPNIVSVFKK